MRSWRACRCLMLWGVTSGPLLLQIRDRAQSPLRGMVEMSKVKRSARGLTTGVSRPHVGQEWPRSPGCGDNHEVAWRSPPTARPGIESPLRTARRLASQHAHLRSKPPSHLGEELPHPQSAWPPPPLFAASFRPTGNELPCPPGPRSPRTGRYGIFGMDKYPGVMRQQRESPRDWLHKCAGIRNSLFMV